MSWKLLNDWLNYVIQLYILNMSWNLLKDWLNYVIHLLYRLHDGGEYGEVTIHGHLCPQPLQTSQSLLK